MYWFIFKCAFCLGVVFLMLPDEDASRVASEVSRAIAQDKIVQAAVERTNLAVQKAAHESQKLCVTNAGECLEAARRLTGGQTLRW
ncbi:MAG: hypothetical protein ACK4MV_01315 [Beijerinckiaceae bacterium]